ncbi:MAG: hypothetical protein HYV29_00180 [Ignavibacteriales bacterium]|nr:hypothetical protein [Ignavibacteriales bacterium]
MVHSPERNNDHSITIDVHSMGAHSRNRQTDGDMLTKIHKEILHCLGKGYTKPQAHLRQRRTSLAGKRQKKWD